MPISQTTEESKLYQLGEDLLAGAVDVVNDYSMLYNNYVFIFHMGTATACTSSKRSVINLCWQDYGVSIIITSSGTNIKQSKVDEFLFRD